MSELLERQADTAVRSTLLRGRFKLGSKATGEMCCSHHRSLFKVPKGEAINPKPPQASDAVRIAPEEEP